MAVTFGYVDDFASAGTNGWTGGTPASNPGSGGVDGPSDGYLRLSQSSPANFGARTFNADYQGNWTAAGITKVTFYLNDLGEPQPFEIHFLISDGVASNTWQYNLGFVPTQGCWKRFTVDLTNPAKWTRTRGTASFAAVLSSVERVTIRHDLAPYVDLPDPIAGDLGVDKIRLGTTTPGCHTPFADADGDGDVDQADFAALQVCRFEQCGLFPPACDCFDRDDDGAVDSADFDAFEACAGGPGIPADPNCGA
jgi:hypothetical protein